MNSALQDLADLWRHAARHAGVPAVATVYEDCAQDVERIVHREAQRNAALSQARFGNGPQRFGGR